jgi:hypothetical protein
LKEYHHNATAGADASFIKKWRQNSMPGKSKTSQSELTLIHTNAAGIDIGSTSHFIAIPVDRCDEPVQECQCFTSDLHRAAQWLKEHGVTNCRNGIHGCLLVTAV